MPDLLVPGTHYAGSQFVTLDGQLRHNLCGPNSLARAESWATQRSVPLADLYHRMRAAGRCDPQGTSTLAGLAAQARADGFQVDVLAYRNPMPEATWRSFFDKYVGKAIILYQTANGQVLRDLLTGAGEDATNLQYHFLDILGYSASRNAWWAADGASDAYNPVVKGIHNRVSNTAQLVLYSDANVAASRPVGAFALLPKFDFGGPPVWQKVNPGLARDSKGHTCGGAMYQFMSDKNLLSADGLSSEVYKTVAGVCDAYLPLSNGVVLSASKVTQNGQQAWQVRSDRGAQLVQALASAPAPSMPAVADPLGDQVRALVKAALA